MKKPFKKEKTVTKKVAKKKQEEKLKINTSFDKALKLLATKKKK